MTKGDLKLLLKKAKEAREGAIESQKIPYTGEGSSVAKGLRPGDSVIPIPKCWKV